MRTSFRTLMAIVAASVFAAVSAAAQPEPIPAELLVLYRAHCGKDIPSFVSTDGEGIRISFDTRGTLAVLGVCIDEHKVAATSEIVSLDEAIAFLALRDAETLWPLAEAKWGNDMSQLRKDLRALAMSTNEETEIGRLMSGKTDVVRARAFALAEIGYFEEALGLLEPAYTNFRALQGDTKSYKIGGSDREFAWILACAHHGLNSPEAARYMGIVNSTEEIPQDKYLDTIRPSSLIKLRMAACMNDQDTYFDLMFSAGFGSMSGIWGAVQSPRVSDDFFLRNDWDVPPTVKAKYLERFRILPDTYTAALNRWQADAPLRNRLRPIVD